MCTGAEVRWSFGFLGASVPHFLLLLIPGVLGVLFRQREHRTERGGCRTTRVVERGLLAHRFRNIVAHGGRRESGTIIETGWEVEFGTRCTVGAGGIVMGIERIIGVVGAGRPKIGSYWFLDANVNKDSRS